MIKKQFTIVYIFGPTQCEEKYFNDEIISLEANEWIKIGETSSNEDLDCLVADYDRDSIPIKNLWCVHFPIPVKDR